MLAMYIATPYPPELAGNSPSTSQKSPSADRLYQHLFMLVENTAQSDHTLRLPANVKTVGDLHTLPNTAAPHYDAHCAVTPDTPVPLAQQQHTHALIVVAPTMFSTVGAPLTNLRQK